MMKPPVSYAILAASLMFCLAGQVTTATQAVSDPSRQIRLTVRVTWKSPNGNSPKELLEDVRTAVTKRLQANGYKVLAPAEGVADYSLAIEYVATGFGEVGYKATLMSANRRSLAMAQGSTVVGRDAAGRHVIYDFVKPVMRENADGSRSPEPDIAAMVKSAIETLGSR
jgi:hypothetical protein